MLVAWRKGSSNSFPNTFSNPPLTNIKYDGGSITMYVRGRLGNVLGKELGDPFR